MGDMLVNTIFSVRLLVFCIYLDINMVFRIFDIGLVFFILFSGIIILYFIIILVIIFLVILYIVYNREFYKKVKNIIFIIINIIRNYFMLW